jgi:hypothetical protein
MAQAADHGQTVRPLVFGAHSQADALVRQEGSHQPLPLDNVRRLVSSMMCLSQGAGQKLQRVELCSGLSCPRL